MWTSFDLSIWLEFDRDENADEPLWWFDEQEAQLGQYRSTAIRQKLNLQTAHPPGGYVFEQSPWLEGIS